MQNTTSSTNGLLYGAALGGGLAWAGPWIWAARPPRDLGAAICAGLVFTIGIAVFTGRGARDPADE